LLSKLGATPQQRSEIEESVQGFVEKLQGHEVAFGRCRSDLADALESASLDEAEIAKMLVQQTETASALRADLLEALERIHGILDPRQRSILARMVRKGPFWGSFSGGRAASHSWRHWAHHAAARGCE
jgi:Spy/CpxP family protein refolding chaperone